MNKGQSQWTLGSMRLRSKSMRWTTRMADKRLGASLEGIEINGGRVGHEQLYYLRSYFEEKELMDLLHKFERFRKDQRDNTMGRHANADVDNIEIEDIFDPEEQARFQEIIEQKAKDAQVRQKQILDFRKEWHKFAMGAFLAYALLFTWIFTIFYFIARLQMLGCETSMVDGSQINNNIQDKGGKSIENCLELDKNNLYFVHNVTFGLITAVVVAQLGDTKNTGESLYERFEPVLMANKQMMRTEKYDRKLVAFGTKRGIGTFKLWSYQIMMKSILWSTKIYVQCWIIFGLVCLFYGGIHGNDASGPLYTTGQTWLGVAITTTYTYFGVDEKDEGFEHDPTKQETTTQDDDDDGHPPRELSKSGDQSQDAQHINSEGDRQVLDSTNTGDAFEVPPTPNTSSLFIMPEPTDVEDLEAGDSPVGKTTLREADNNKTPKTITENSTSFGTGVDLMADTGDDDAYHHHFELFPRKPSSTENTEVDSSIESRPMEARKAQSSRLAEEDVENRLAKLEQQLLVAMDAKCVHDSTSTNDGKDSHVDKEEVDRSGIDSSSFSSDDIDGTREYSRTTISLPI